MAKGAITSVTVAASGDYVTIVVEAAAVDVDAYADYALDADGTPKVVLSLTRPAYTATGATTTIADTVIGTYPVRKAYPNNADLDVVDNGGSPNTVTLKLWLSEYIFGSDTVVTADFTAGWFVNASVGASSVSVTNSSTATYPKPIARWVTVPYQRVTGDFEVEVAASHKFGIAVVEFDCADQSANSITTIETTTETWSTLPTQGNGHSCYAATIPVTSLTALDMLDCQFIVYPAIGDVTLDSRTTADGTAQPSGLMGPLHMLNDKSDTYGVSYVAVSNTGNDGTGVASETETTAIASPFLTVPAAAAAAKAYNNTNFTRNTIGASECVMLDGFNGDFSTTGITGGNTDTHFIIRPDAGATYSLGTSTTGAGNTGYFRIKECTPTASGVGVIRGGASSLVWFDSCIDITWTGAASNWLWPMRYLTNSTITDWNDFGYYSTTTSVWGIVQGNSFSQFADNRIRPYLSIGNTGDLRYQDNVANSDPVAELSIIAYNTNRADRTTLVSNMIAYNKVLSLGAAIYNNIFDDTAATPPSTALIYLWGDGVTEAAQNIIIRGNDFEGQRTNLFYNDTSNPVFKFITYEYNTLYDGNCKSDIFATDGLNVNNWSVLNGLGMIGNNDHEQGGAGTSFRFEFAGLDHTTLDPSYTNQSTGDYTPTGTNLYKGSGTSPLKYDINGTLRTDLWAGAVTVASAGGWLNRNYFWDNM
jgi:hypothetical protein